MTDAKPSRQLDLVEPPPGDITVVNGRCVIYEQEGICIVVIAGVPVHRFPRADKFSRDVVIAQALDAKWATGRELASAFGISVGTVVRIRRRWRDGGVKGLLPKKPGPPQGQWLQEAEQKAIRKWHEQGVGGREIARRLKKAPGTVQKAIGRMGLPPHRPRAQQQSLLRGDEASTEAKDDPDPAPSTEGESAETEPAEAATALPVPPRSWGGDPFDRSIDRLLASQGLLLDADPLFASGEALPRLGVLLAVPLIVASGLFTEAERLYGHIGPAFYGLRTSLLVLVLMGLLRIKHPENLKEYSPPELGRIIGLDRAPEVKTLRRKLERLAAGPSETLLAALAKRRIAAREEAMGFLYVDGHVRVYSGQQRLPKAHVARMRISLPATQDVWVNDAEGDPVFFITQEAHPQLVSALPPVLDEVREFVGDDRRITVVFDRGGWSPSLFKKMVAAGFDVLTYRKGTVEPIPAEDFEEHDAPGLDGRVQWLLHERSVLVGSEKDRLWMRQVTRQKGDHQTHIVTTRQQLELTQVAWRMFARWRQENFLKYMRQEFALDALVEYGSEDEDPRRDTPNPKWTHADKAWRAARKKTRKLKAAYAELALARQPVPAEMLAALAEVTELEEARKTTRDGLPSRVTVGALDEDRRTVRLPARRKRLSDGLKMLGYQVESDLVRLVAPYYARVLDEGRTLIATTLQSAGDLEVTDTDLRVTLAPQSSPHRTRAIAELCRKLDATETRFPGTGLRLRYAIREPPMLTLA